MIFTPKNPNANAGSILVAGHGAELCCGDDARSLFVTAEFDGTTADVTHVNVTVPGGSAQTVALTAGIDLSTASPTTDALLAQYLGKVATDLGFVWLDGGIELVRNASNSDLVKVRVKDSTLDFNWIGVPTTFENAFTKTASVP